MRALMSMKVTLEEAGDRAPTRYPSPEQIAEALTAVGLRPPSLVAPKPPPEVGVAGTSESAVFQKLAKVATSIVVEGNSQTQDDLLRSASTMPEGQEAPTFAALARGHQSRGEIDDRVVSIASYALPVLMRMPVRNAEDREKRRLAAESLVYASVVTPTRSQFVVSSENQSAVTVRLHNQLIESLREGCEHLLAVLSAPIEIEGGKLTFALQGRIEIYEVGQEDSTISGRLVGFSTRDRLRFLKETQRVNVFVALVLSFAFVVLFAYLFLHHLSEGTTLVAVHGTPGSFFLEQPDNFWLGEAERLQSGVIPVLLVTGFTLLLKYPQGEVVRWSQLLRPDGDS
jgi:uncharacterized protein (DUF1778 family)